MKATEQPTPVIDEVIPLGTMGQRAAQPRDHELHFHPPDDGGGTSDQGDGAV